MLVCIYFAVWWLLKIVTLQCMVKIDDVQAHNVSQYPAIFWKCSPTNRGPIKARGWFHKYILNRLFSHFQYFQECSKIPDLQAEYPMKRSKMTQMRSWVLTRFKAHAVHTDMFTVCRCCSVLTSVMIFQMCLKGFILVGMKR